MFKLAKWNYLSCSSFSGICASSYEMSLDDWYSWLRRLFLNELCCTTFYCYIDSIRKLCWINMRVKCANIQPFIQHRHISSYEKISIIEIKDILVNLIQSAWAVLIIRESILHFVRAISSSRKLEDSWIVSKRNSEWILINTQLWDFKVCVIVLYWTTYYLDIDLRGY